MKFDFLKSLRVDDCSYRMYEAEYRGVKFFKQTSTKLCVHTGKVDGKTEVIYFFNDDTREFKNLKKILENIDRKVRR